MPATPVLMTFQNSDGTPVSNGKITASLSEDCVDRSTGSQICAGILIRGHLDNKGTTTSDFRLWPSDQLTPGDSYYTLKVFDFYGRFVWEGTVANRTAAITYVIDGEGSVPSTGVKGQISIPTACTITGWVISADQSGSCVVDVLKASYSGFPSTVSIAGSEKPTLASAQKNENLAVSTWTTAVAAGDLIQFSLSSISTVTRINLTLNITIP